MIFSAFISIKKILPDILNNNKSILLTLKQFLMNTSPLKILLLSVFILLIGNTSFAQTQSCTHILNSINWPTDALKIAIGTDKFADTNAHTIITCTIKGVEINGMMLPPAISDKYRKIIESQTATTVKRKGDMITLNLNDPALKKANKKQ